MPAWRTCAAALRMQSRRAASRSRQLDVIDRPPRGIMLASGAEADHLAASRTVRQGEKTGDGEDDGRGMHMWDER